MPDITYSPDAAPEDADWTKQKAWDFPPYKSREFMEGLVGTLDEFRKSPAYKAAEEQGLILDDEWVADWIELKPTPKNGRRSIHIHID